MRFGWFSDHRCQVDHSEQPAEADKYGGNCKLIDKETLEEMVLW